MSSVADLVVDRLRAAGVRALFGVPGGGSNLDLVEAAGATGLPFVLTSTETAAALAAVAQSEVAAGCGACLTTLGPGVTSVVNGVACALLDRAPLVVFTDMHPASAAAMTHQRIDHRALMRPVTKWSRTLGRDRTADVLDRALAIAMDLPPGPVHLDCAWNGSEDHVGSAPVDRADAPTTLGAATTFRNSEFDTIVSRARRPLLLVGLGAREREAAAAIRRFCERRRLPAMVTYKAKGVLQDAAAFFAGVFTNGAVERAVIDDADLLVGVGLDPVELIPRPWTFRQPIVYCGPGPMFGGHVPFAAQCVGAVGPALAHLDGVLPPAEWDLNATRRKFEAAQAAVRLPRADGLTPDRVVDIAAFRLASSHRVTVDAGAHMFPATMLWPVSEPGGMLISNGLSTMGFAVPAAIGAALADRERPVVALTGDGGLLMCAGELLTAAREHLRIMTIVFSDASLSLIEIKQQARELRPSGVALGAVAWPQLAGSLGVAAFSASTAAEFDRAIDAALGVPGPSLVEARIDRTSYSRVLRAIRG